MLQIYNTATRKKEIFYKKPGEEVKMYNCGLTVYERPQIGNLRAYTMADTLRRSLEFLGYEVKQVQNFTDVGHETLTDEQKAQIKGEIEITDTDNGIDRMEKAAKKTGLTVWEVADKAIGEAMKDFEAMNFLEPFKRPRATDHIEEQKELIIKLLEKGFAYITNSAVYYDTSKFFEYGALSGQKLSDKKSGAREEVELDPEKRNPSDFRLWQYNRPDHAMQWDFEINGKNYKGYPGWHIECSAMAYKYLGNPIDIHTGGEDHIPVHHPNEIAQSEPVYGKPFVIFWYHNAFLTVDGRRMGKSLGNVYNLEDIKSKGYSPLDLRYFYLTADFRKPQNFSWEALESAKAARGKLQNHINSPRNALDLNPDEMQLTDEVSKSIWYKKFTEAIEDSFNMPQAVAVVWEMLNSKDPKFTDVQKVKVMKKFDEVLGLKLFESIENEKLNQSEINPKLIKKIEEIIIKRNKAKAEKDFEAADKLRNEAKKLGFELIDKPEGTEFRKI